MSPVERFERVLKDLDRLAVKARKAGNLAKSLDDKVQAQRVRRVLETTRQTLRLQYYEFEDVAKHLSEPPVVLTGQGSYAKAWPEGGP